MKALIALATIVGSFSSYALTVDEISRRLPENVEVNTIKINPDKSVTMENIFFLQIQNNIRMRFAENDSNKKQLCQYLNFDKSLPLGEIPTSLDSEDTLSKVTILENGEATLASLAPAQSKFMNKITCYNNIEKEDVFEFEQSSSKESNSRRNLYYVAGENKYRLAVSEMNLDIVCEKLKFKGALLSSKGNRIDKLSTPEIMTVYDFENERFTFALSREYISQLVCE